MTKEEIILKLVLSLNAGNGEYVDDRVAYAMIQYDQLVRAGIIKEDTTDAEAL